MSSKNPVDNMKDSEEMRDNKEKEARIYDTVKIRAKIETMPNVQPRVITSEMVR
jgi:hypothetical protein